jgi:hypothetical protein
MIANRKELIDINIGLKGWPEEKDILAPCYYACDEEAQAVFHYLTNGQHYKQIDIEKINYRKTLATNFQNIVLGEPVLNEKGYLEDTKKFLEELKLEITNINNVLIKVGVKEEGLELFNLFVSETSPLLYNMGFADAIPHSAQVAKKCIFEAYRREGTNSQILQSAMVGWIHDPKVPIKYSWSNLATHPIIGSAIALDVLNKPKLKEKLDTYITKYFITTTVNSEKFIKGVVEALAINNDSEYVLRNGILYRPEWAPGPKEPGGVIDQIAAMPEEYIKELGIKLTPEQLAQKLEENAVKWFEAPVNKGDTYDIDGDLGIILEQIKLQTGIRGYIKSTFEKAIHYSFNKIDHCKNKPADEIFYDILNARISDQETLKNLHDSLKSLETLKEEIYEVIEVSGTSLFTHYLGVQDSTIAALALEIADPLLLSPQKLMAEGVKLTSLQQMDDFLVSFEKNIRYLPKEARNDGKIWQRDLYFSIIEAADELTYQNKTKVFLEKFHQYGDKYKPFATPYNSEIDIGIVEEQISKLAIMIRDPLTWINLQQRRDFASTNRYDSSEQDKLEILIETLKRYYDRAVEESPEMFGLIKIEETVSNQN